MRLLPFLYLILLMGCQSDLESSSETKTPIVNGRSVNHETRLFSVGAFPEELDGIDWPGLKCLNFYEDELDCFTRIFDTLIQTNLPDKNINCRVWHSSADSWSSCHRYWLNSGADSVYLHSSIDWKGFNMFYWMNDELLLYNGLVGYRDTDPDLGADDQCGELFLLNVKTGKKSSVAFEYPYKDAALYYSGYRNGKLNYSSDYRKRNYYTWVMQNAEINEDELSKSEQQALKEWIEDVFQRKGRDI